MTIKKYIGFSDFWLRIIGLPLLGFFISTLFFGNHPNILGWKNFAINWLYSTIYSIFFYESVRIAFIRLWKTYPKLQALRKRLPRQMVFVLLLGVLGTYILDWIHHIFIVGIWRMPDPTLLEISVSTFMCIFGGTFYEASYYLYQLRRTAQEKEMFRHQSLQNELAGLRAQVNPHFLFNSLNTLIYLIPEDEKKAVRFVRQLSRTYRYILEVGTKELVLLEEELEFLSAYVFLMKERFGNNLQIEIDIPEEVKNKYIVPLGLQLLFENALKHNTVASDQPLHIKVKIEKAYIVISNDLQIRLKSKPGTGTGLNNLRNRYRFFTTQPVVVESTQQKFTVKLPLLTLLEKDHSTNALSYAHSPS